MVQQVLLQNRGWKALVTQRILGRAKVEISCAVITAGKSAACFQLPLCLYDVRAALFCEEKCITRFADKPVHGVFDSGIVVKCRGQTGSYSVQVRFNSTCAYHWPEIPVNVRLPGRPPMAFENAVLPLTFALKAPGQKIVLCVEVVNEHLSMARAS